MTLEFQASVSGGMDEPVRNSMQLELYRDIVEASAAPICAFDREYRLIAFNKAHSDEFYRIFAHRVKIGEVFPDLFSPDQAPIMRGLMDRALTGEIYTVTEEFGDINLAKPVWEVSYSPLKNAEGEIIGAFHYAKDISARLRVESEIALMQEALRQSQKMEAVGQLTGGLAHDFNNLLAGISGSLDLILLRFRKDNNVDDIERYIAIAKSGVKRAAALTHRLLAFSRRQTLAPRATDVLQLVDGMRELIERTVGPSIQVDVSSMPNAWLILVDQSQLENALLNLCINARDAMPCGGTISIGIANDTFDLSKAKQLDIEPGEYLKLSVGDTGEGMTEEVQVRAFEPFFTTKPTGEGTGLGLSMVYGFAKQSGGQIHITSAVRSGTSVSLYLPRHAGGISHPEPVADVAPHVSADFHETILVIDDEENIRIILEEILINMGFNVLHAAESTAALKILQSNRSIDLLITDVGLPGGVNGRQIADIARTVRPDLGVLFITGYAEKSVFGNAGLSSGMSVLTKPFELDDVTQQVSAMIAERRARYASGAT